MSVKKGPHGLRGTWRFLRSELRTTRAMLEQETGMAVHAVRNGLALALVGRLAGKAVESPQAILSWPTQLPEVDESSRLTAWLSERGIHYRQGRWTIYLPPQPGLEAVIGNASTFYPRAAGFKILKDFRAPEVSHYATYRGHRLKRALMGTAREHVRSALLLQAYDLGPRIYDLAALTAGRTTLTAFVVEHVEGGQPTLPEYDRFMDRMTSVLRSTELVQLPEVGSTPRDFDPPLCNGNLLKTGDAREAVYVDFQNFIVRNPDQALADYVASVPMDGTDGSAASRTRDAVFGLLNQTGVDLRGRLVLQLGGDGGILLAAALDRGASWTVGLEAPGVARHTERLLALRGYTRVEIAGANLSIDYPLVANLPSRLAAALPGAVIFHLATGWSGDMVKELERMPWQVLVYQGRQGEGISAMHGRLAPLASAWGFDIAACAERQGTDHGGRPLAVLVRENPS